MKKWLNIALLMMFLLAGRAYANLEVIDDNTGDPVFQVTDTTSGDLLQLLQNGNVGIDTTVPAAALHIGTGDPDESVITGTSDVYIADDLEVDGQIYGTLNGSFAIGEDLDMGGYMIESSTDGILFDTDDDGTADIVFNTAGNIGIGTLTPSASIAFPGDFISTEAAGGVGNPAYIFDTNGDLWGNGEQIISFREDGTEFIYLDGLGALTASNGFFEAESTAPESGAGAFIGSGMRRVSTTVGFNFAWGESIASTTEPGFDLFPLSGTHITNGILFRLSKDSARTDVALQVDGNGNVGVGTTIPLAALFVGDGDPDETAITGTDDAYIAGDLEVDGVLYGDGSGLSNISAGGFTDGGANVYVTTSTDNVGIGSIDASAMLEIVRDSTDYTFMISSDATADGDMFMVDSFGFVGIGTDAPTAHLHVRTPSSFSTIARFYDGDDEMIRFNSSSLAGAIQTRDSSGASFVFGIENATEDFVIGEDSNFLGGSTHVFRIQEGGNVGIGTDTTPDAMLDIAQSNDRELFMLSSGVDGDGDILMVQSDGNVGVGTSSPTALFTVETSNADSNIATFMASLSNTEYQSLSFYEDNADFEMGSIRMTRDANGGKLTMFLRNADSGAQDEMLTINARDDTDVVFNEGGLDHNLRVEAVGATHALFVDGGTGNVGLGTSIPQEDFEVVGNILSSGTITPSDMNLKKDIEVLETALDKIAEVEGVTYQWKDDARGAGEQIGIIAQDLEEVYPEAVITYPDGTKGVNYPVLVAPLIEAVKELQQENIKLREELDGRIQRLEVELNLTKRN